jgi:hypothetical protein
MYVPAPGVGGTGGAVFGATGAPGAAGVEITGDESIIMPP